MGEFAAALAHEINQPLTAVANYARLAKSASDPAVASDASDRVIAQVERAAEVVRRLRNFIRPGRSEMSAIAVPKLVYEAAAYCRAELDRQGIELQARISRDLPPVKADALQIEEVIVNLVRNAAEALTDAGRYDGKVTVSADRADAGSVIVAGNLRGLWRCRERVAPGQLALRQPHGNLDRVAVRPAMRIADRDASQQQLHRIVDVALVVSWSESGWRRGPRRSCRRPSSRRQRGSWHRRCRRCP